MTSLNLDPQGTDHLFTVPFDTTARHRDDTPPGPPLWFLLVMTGAAFLVGVDAFLTRSLPLMLLAALYACIAFVFDVWAALARRRGTES